MEDNFFKTDVTPAVVEKQEAPTQDVAETPTETPAEQPKETPKETPKADVQGKQEQPKEVQKEKPTASEETRKPLEIQINPTKDKPKEQPKADAKTEQPKATLSDADVLTYLKAKGIEVDSIDKLGRKEQLPDDVQKFAQFKKETNGSYKDFLKVNTDWSKQPKDEVIKEYFKKKYPTFSEDVLNDKLELIKVNDEMKDELEENEYRKRVVEYNEIYNEALSSMTEFSNKYRTELENKAQEPVRQEIDKQKMLEYQKRYIEEREKSLSELNDTTIKVGDLGEIKIPIQDEYKDLVRKYTDTEQDFFKLWQGEKGFDTKAMVEDFQWAIPEVRKNFISEIINQANLLFMESMSRENRNVDLADLKTKNVEQKGSFEVIHQGKTQEDNFFKPQ